MGATGGRFRYVLAPSGTPPARCAGYRKLRSRRTVHASRHDESAAISRARDSLACRSCAELAGLFRYTVRTRTRDRSEEHTSELQSLMRISYAVFCLKKKK